VDGKRTWTDAAPRRPRTGAGRAALVRRAKARAGKTRPGERRGAEAARRGLRRGRTRRRGPAGPIRGAAAELRRFSKLIEQKFVTRQRLRHLLMALAAIWALWTFALGDASLPKLWATKRQNAKLSAEIDDLTVRERQARADVAALEASDHEALEIAAREEFGLVRDGEKIVRFYEGDGERAEDDDR
jgi:cell division protein FtsB